MDNKKIKLAIVEDHKEMREMMHEYFLKDKENFESTVSFDSVEQILNQQELQDYFLLLDINLPGLSGIEGIPLLKKKFSGMEILMISVLTDSESIFNAICAGASGYIDKDTPLPKIKEALLNLRDGGSPITPSIARKVFDYFQPDKKVEVALSEREEGVVKGIVEGLSYKLVADKLFISINTVRKYIRQIYAKLEINSKGELISRFHQSYGSKK